MTIFLAKWLHKHGEDVAAFYEEDAAYKQCVLWMRETLADWTDGQSDYTDDALFDSWTEITGENEFMSVEPLEVHGGA